MFLKPAAGLKVFDPDRHDYLPPEGREVGPRESHGYFWHRRLEEGDVTELSEADAAASLAEAEDARKAAQAQADKDAADAEKVRRDALTPAQRAAEDADAKKKAETIRRAGLTQEQRDAEDATAAAAKKPDPKAKV